MFHHSDIRSLLSTSVLPTGHMNAATVPTLASVFAGTPIKMPFEEVSRG